MSTNIYRSLKAATILLAVVSIFSCSSDSGDLSNLLPNDGGEDDGSDRTAGGSYSTGTWKASGTNSDGNAFRACFNISVDGKTLTTNGSSCTSYQNAFSVDVDGSTDCNVYYDNNPSDPTNWPAIPINSDGTFSYNFQPDARAPKLAFEGTITNGDAKGTITVDNTAWGAPSPCVAEWVAYAPGNTSTDDIIADNPDDNTTAPGDRPAAGTWTGSGTNAEGDSFTACLVVSSDGTKLIRNNTCTGNQGQNNNQFDVQIERGENDCYLYLGDGDSDSQIEVPIVNNRIALNNYKPSSFAPTLNFEGTFNGNTVSGTITINSQYPNGSCKGSWSATAP